MIILFHFSIVGYRLEGSTNVFANIFSYLEDKGLQGELWGRVTTKKYDISGCVELFLYCLSMLAVAIEMIANKLFNKYLEQMEAKVIHKCQVIVM